MRSRDMGPSEVGFYVLAAYGGEYLWGRFAHASPPDGEYGPPGGRGVCPGCRQALGSCRWRLPHRIELSKANYGDFVWGAGVDLLMSAQALEAYRAAGLTGIIEIGPTIEVVRVGSRKPEALKNQPPEYHEVIYQLDGADLDDDLSHARRETVPPRCKVCRMNMDSVRGVFLKRGSWRRADIFGALGLPGITLITEPFRSMILRTGLAGADIIPTERYWDEPRPWHPEYRLCDPQDPGDSEVWFPPERNLPVVT